MRVASQGVEQADVGLQLAQQLTRFDTTLAGTGQQRLHIGVAGLLFNQSQRRAILGFLTLWVKRLAGVAGRCAAAAPLACHCVAADCGCAARMQGFAPA